jgi:hypothetical protein
MARFDPHFLDDIRARLPISQVIGGRVTWDRKKTNVSRGDYWACCPFHGEKGASFHCEDKKGRYHCFGCSMSGDHFKFLTEMDGVDFPRAVEILAGMAGMSMPDARPPTAAELEERRRRDAQRQAEAVKRQAETEKANARRVMNAGAIWKETIQLQGTPGQTYFEWRGLPMPIDSNLRFHHALEHPEIDGARHACIVARVQDVEGKGVGIWRIYLQPDGQGKLAGVTAKLGLGPTAGGAVRLDGVAKHIGLAEGIETARAVRALGHNIPIWAGLSTSGIIGFAWPEGVDRITVFPDRDRRKIRTRDDGRIQRSPGLAAFEKFVENNPGRDIRLGPGPEDDDYLELWQRMNGMPVR